MTDLHERFRDLDRAAVPDVWARVDVRGPQPPMTFPIPRPRRLAAAALALTLVVGVAGLLLVRSADPPTQPVGTVTPAPSPEVEGARVTARIPAGQFPHQVAIGFGSVWVGAVTEEPGPIVRELLRIDPTTAEVIARIPVTDLPGWEAGNAGTAVGQGALWLAGVGALERIDPATNESEVVPLDVGHFHADVWVDDEGGWVLSFGEADSSMLVTRFDPGTGDPIWTQPVPLRWGLAIVRSGSSLWVWGDGAESGPMEPGTLVRLDAATGSVQEELASQNPPAVAPDGRVWAGRDGVLGLLEPGGSFTAIEPTTENVLGFFSPVPDGAEGVWLQSRPAGRFVLTHVTAAGIADRIVEAPRDAGGQSSAYDRVTDTFWFALFKDEATRLTLGRD